MIKLTFVLRRRAELSPDAFREYWRERHAPLVSRHADALHIRRYVQTHPVDNPLDGPLGESRQTTVEPYDGVAELWWDSIEDLPAVLETPEGQQAAADLLEDEARFIDLPACTLWFGEENVVVDEVPA
jgi:uncharacterized protein (TIGR02118 family)